MRPLPSFMLRLERSAVAFGRRALEHESVAWTRARLVALRSTLAASPVARPHRLFVLVGLAAGIPLVFITPPFQVPDEDAHFFRAYQVSEGGVVAQWLGTCAGGQLPRSLERTVSLVSGDVRFHPKIKQDPAALAVALDMPLAPEARRGECFPGAALYPPLPYLPQALGILPARLLRLSPVEVLWAGRLANLVLAVLLSAVALRLMPFGGWSLAAVSLLPTSLFLRSSVSADVPTSALVLLAVALLTRAVVARGRPFGRADFAGLVGSGAAVALCKPTYVVIMLLALAIPGDRFRTGWRRVLAVGATIAIPAAAQVAWTQVVRLGWDQGTSGAQFAYVLGNPLRTLVVLGGDFLASFTVRWHELVGQLGWLDTSLPARGMTALSVLLIVVLLAEALAARHPAWALNIVAAATVLAGLLAVQAALYVWWTPVGAASVTGVQGRYFLPMMFVLVLAVPRLNLFPKVLGVVRAVSVSGLTVVSVIVTTRALVARFYGG